jgi:trans-aconitate methyltransferase
MLDRSRLAEVAKKESAESASNYIHYSAQQQKAAESLSTTILSYFGDRKNLRFYDVGCGTGGLLNQLRSEGYQGGFWGADYSKERIRLARQQNKAEASNGKIHYHKQDAQHACRFVNTYDILFATSMLHHIAAEEHPTVFKQFFRTLRAGGYLGIVTYGPNMPLDKAIKEFIAEQGAHYALAGYQSPRVYLSHAQYKENLEKAGFIVKSEADKTYRVSSEVEPLSHWLKGWLPSYQYLCFEKADAALAERYLSALCSNLHARFPEGIPIPHMELIARKPVNDLDHAIAFGTRALARKRSFEEEAERPARNLRPRL